MASFVVNMDMIQILHSILINTFNAEMTLRAEAEESLKRFLAMPNALLTLLCFIGNHEIHRDLRQAAAIAAKNNSKNFFRTDESAIIISEQEKELIKPAVLDVLLNESDNSVRGLLAETIKNISEFEYPAR